MSIKCFVKNKIWFNVIKIILVSFLIGVLIGWRMVKGDDILSFIGAVLGVIATYGAFYLGANKEKEKEKKYKKLMLFNLLDYTVFNTKTIYRDLNNYYKRSIQDANNQGIDLINIMYVLSGLSEDEGVIGQELSEDISIIYMFSQNEQITELIRGLNRYFSEHILRQIDLSDLIYDNNWCSYIDCISDIKDDGVNRDMQRIINWIGTLKRQYTDCTEYEVVNFIMQRECIKKIIDELGKEIKEQGFRSILDI